jgi:hypothetical protein
MQSRGFMEADKHAKIVSYQGETRRRIFDASKIIAMTSFIFTSTPNKPANGIDISSAMGGMGGFEMATNSSLTMTTDAPSATPSDAPRTLDDVMKAAKKPSAEINAMTHGVSR